MSVTKQEVLEALEDCESAYDLAFGGNVRPIVHKGTDTQAFFLSREKDAVLVFRGTEPSLRDWITDISCRPAVVPYGNHTSEVRVHSGFLASYRAVRGEILQVLRSVTFERLTITGHSLGGVLALLAAVDIEYNELCDCPVCITFGAPRPGNRAFCGSFNRRIPYLYRFEGRFDIVPKLAPWHKQPRKPTWLRCRHDLKTYRNAIKKMNFIQLLGGKK